ncbi:MAG: methyl-accepting chemotaxis protein [Pseudomonadota bacterium]
MISTLRALLGNNSQGTAEFDKRASEHSAIMAALSRSQAIIEFELDGTIITANENFLNTTGYSLEEIVGQHHRIFVAKDYARSANYRDFWQRLGRGESCSGEYQRFDKQGRSVWMQASYNAVLDANGKTTKLIKVASDVTAQKERSVDLQGKLDAINKSAAVIEFKMDGMIITANDNFLDAMGYRLDEVKGRHHSMFADDEYAASAEYRAFWEKLNRGEFDAGEYLRFGKGGKEVWIQATYNPTLNAAGNPTKVVKYATDVSAQHEMKKNIASVLKETADVLSGVAEGDLTRNITSEFPEEFVALKHATNATIDKLKSVVSGIKGSSNSVKNGAAEITQGNNSLSARTEQQASSLEETASSMEEMTSTVKQNADNASQANQLAMTARSEAEQGGAVVNDAVKAMQAIADSSRKISDIIGVIDEIAFQTNLLALNASVEAARAGDQGRGFAVVASEVRNLAGRSATAAREIKDLIEDSGRKVEEGASLVNKSGESLDSIVSGVKKVTDIVGEIAAASQEQSAGINEVNNAVIQLEEVTQQNAALVEQAAAASQTMGQQAETLASLIGYFRVGAEAAIPSSNTRMAVERRSSARPWTSTAAEAPSVSNDAPPQRAVANGNDLEWEEF